MNVDAAPRGITNRYGDAISVEKSTEHPEILCAYTRIKFERVSCPIEARISQVRVMCGSEASRYLFAPSRTRPLTEALEVGARVGIGRTEGGGHV